MEKTNKHHEMILWLLARYVIFITPVTLTVVAMIKNLFNHEVGIWEFLLIIYVCEKIMTYYEHLDFEITTYILNKKDED